MILEFARRIAARFQARPAAPPAELDEAPPRPLYGAGPQYITRHDGLIRIDADRVSVHPFEARRSWPRGEHPYPVRPYPSSWTDHALTRLDLPVLPPARPYTELRKISEEWCWR